MPPWAHPAVHRPLHMHIQLCHDLECTSRCCMPLHAHATVALGCTSSCCMTLELPSSCTTHPYMPIQLLPLHAHPAVPCTSMRIQLCHAPVCTSSACTTLVCTSLYAHPAVVPMCTSSCCPFTPTQLRLQLCTPSLHRAPPSQSSTVPACPSHNDSSFFSPSLTAAATNQSAAPRCWTNHQ